jgi:uncharacterized protein
MDQAVKDFIKGQRFAIAGLSRSGGKFGNSIYKELKERGYKMFAIHPEAAEIGGAPCYSSLSALPEPVDGLIVCVAPGKVEPLLHEAMKVDVKNVWLQQGAQTPETVKLAKSLGLNVIAGKCILMYAEPVRSVHSFHRSIVKLFGRL